MSLMRVSMHLVLLLGAAGLAACPQRSPVPAESGAAPPSPRPSSGPGLCRLVQVTPLPAGAAGIGPGRFGVELGIETEVLAAHEARFRRYGILPNGQAWADVIEQCLSKSDPAALRGVHLDPEAGALNSWVETDADKDRWVAALCRALDEPGWLDRCLATVDRSRVDD